MSLTALLKFKRQRQRVVDGESKAEAFTELDVNLNFKLGGEKEMVEAYATAGKKNVGAATIHYEGNTTWARPGKPLPAKSVKGRKSPALKAES